jgi:osmotically-inducible protein OsmY
MKHFGRNKKVQINAMYYVVLIVAVITLLVTSVPVRASEMDDRIELSIKKSYVFKTYLKGDDIKIQSVDGVVILTGIVSEEYHKALAQETVASLPGVKSIVNKLGIKGAPPTGNSDGWLNEKVRAILVLHKSVDAGATIIYVKDGIVNLSGEAISEAQKELTTEYAKDVEGVKGVNNEMTVTKTSKKTLPAGEKIDDASITAQVKMTLLYHRSTSALNTKVETKRGAVTLYGKARSATEWNMATKLAEDVNGVKSVKNRMTIE